MKTIIAGSRNLGSTDFVRHVLTGVDWEITHVISGGARGVDTCGEYWAERNEIPVTVFPAEWDKYGKAAGPIRNKQMAEVADALVAIQWQGSRGTEHMIKTMRDMGKPVHVVKITVEN